MCVRPSSSVVVVVVVILSLPYPFLHQAAAAPSYAAANPKLLLVTELLTLEEQQRELLGSIEVDGFVRTRAVSRESLASRRGAYG